MTLVVLGTLFLLLVLRETTRDALPADRAHRAALAAVVVAPLVVCAVLVVVARTLELGA